MLCYRLRWNQSNTFIRNLSLAINFIHIRMAKGRSRRRYPGSSGNTGRSRTLNTYCSTSSCTYSRTHAQASRCLIKLRCLPGSKIWITRKRQ